MKKSLLVIGVLITILLSGCLKEYDLKDAVIVSTPQLSTTVASNVKYTTATLSSKVLNNPQWRYKIEERGFVWSKNNNPTYTENDGKSVNESGFGSFTADIMDLDPGSTHYIRSYAKNGNNIGYGEQIDITTSTGILPTVTIGDVTDVRYTTAKALGEVTVTGGKPVTERGFVWSTTTKPTYSSNTGKSSNGSGIGVFSSNINDLIYNSTYYVRAYAKSEIGVGYSSEVSFTTLGKSIITITVKGVNFDMVKVEGGTFEMGAGNGGGDITPIHSVTLSDYCIGKTEVTQALWEAVMGSNPSIFKGSNLPVERVSWSDCQEFIRQLNAATGKTFRLPTEAEWEYAAKGGNKSKGYKYSGSNDINSVGWYDSNSDITTHAVGTKQSNELGLYDMSGNVCEWCRDWYEAYSSNAQTNPTGAASGSLRVYRGGSWLDYAGFCRVAYRNYINPEFRYNYVGLRLVFVP